MRIDLRNTVVHIVENKTLCNASYSYLSFRSFYNVLLRELKLSYLSIAVLFSRALIIFYGYGSMKYREIKENKIPRNIETLIKANAERSSLPRHVFSPDNTCKTFESR